MRLYIHIYIYISISAPQISKPSTTPEDWYRAYIIIRTAMKLDNRQKYKNTRNRGDMAKIPLFLTTEEERTRPSDLSASNAPSADGVLSTDNIDRSSRVIKLMLDNGSQEDKEDERTLKPNKPSIDNQLRDFEALEADL